MKITLQRTIFILIATLVISAAIAGCAPASDSATSDKVITDMSGRSVTLPETVSRIYCADAMSAITVYTLAPDKLLGWCYQFNDYEAAYLTEEAQNLPVFGMKDNVNYEAVIDAEPDIAVLTGTIGDSIIEQADELQERLGVPVVVLDNSLSETPEVYTLLSNATGDTDQGEKLSAYAQETLDAVQEIPEDEQITIYYANGVDSLNTSSKGSAASEIFDLVGANNVCTMTSESGDRIQITKEHVLDWNPEYIFVNGEPTEDFSGSDAAQQLIEDSEYANIKAVQGGKVYSIPKSPFAWLDRPRSINRLIGITWLGSILYPDYYEFDDDTLREFYSLFYHIDLTDAQIAELLSQ